jgi:RNA polymerase sigma-70 factor (ECF subfamily)
MVHFRLDPRLRGRVDADDILQEAYLNAAQRLEHFLRETSMSIYVWIRQIVYQTLIDVHRRHVGAKVRDAGREVSLQRAGFPAATSTSLALQLAGNLTSPSQAAMRAEMIEQLESALQTMNPTDREVLALRHFEELANHEVAEVLGIQPKAASIRYIRALDRLKTILSKLPGFQDGQGKSDS